LFLGIVRWQNKWWFSGISYTQPYNNQIVLEEKRSLNHRAVTNFLDSNKIEMLEVINSHLKVFKEFNNDSQIAFIPSKKIDSFLKNYTAFYNQSLNLPKKQIKETKQEIRQKGFDSKSQNHINYSEVSDSAIIFFNPKSGIEIALAVNSAFPLPENPYFNKNYSKESMKILLFSQDISPELVMFCIDNCKNDLPFFIDGPGKILLPDIDFLLRFWKKESYHANPALNYTNI